MRLTIILTTILILGLSYAVQDNGTTQVLNPQFSGANLSIPKSINFQGYLYRDGNPMDTTMNMWFGIYTALSGGSLLFQQTINNVEVMNGWFTITLDNIPNTVFPVSGPTRYLEVKAPSTGPALEPRFSLVSVGYSYHAITSDTAEFAKVAPVGSHSHTLTHTGEVTGSGSVNGSWALTITNGAVTNAKLGPNAVTTGKIQNGTILPEDLSFVPVTRPLTPPLSGAEIAIPCTLKGSIAYPGGILNIRNNDPNGNGIIIDRAGWYGIFVDTVVDYGVWVNNCWTGYSVNRATSNGIWIERAGANGIQIDSTGGNGIWINRTGTNGLRVYNADENGLFVDSAGFAGLWVRRAFSGAIMDTVLYGLYVDSARYDGVDVYKAGADGISVYYAADDGYSVNGCGDDGLYIANAGDNGVYIGDAGTVGVYVMRCDTGLMVYRGNVYGVRVDSAGTSALSVDYSNVQGLWIANAATYGIRVANAGYYGIYSNSTDGRGGYFTNNNNDYYALTAWNSTGTGATVKGLYVHGNGYATGGWSSFLTDGKTGFSLTSPDMEIVTSGSSTLVNGEAMITFEQAVKEALSSDAPLKVIVTPTSQCNGVFVDTKSSAGFLVKELINGKSNATFDWIAIGRMKGYEERPAISPITVQQLKQDEQGRLTSEDGLTIREEPFQIKQIVHENKTEKWVSPINER